MAMILPNDDLNTDLPVLLVKITKQYKDGMSTNEIYEAARWCWRLNEQRVAKVRYVLAVAGGRVVGVFEPHYFNRVTEQTAHVPTDVGRLFFEGLPVANELLGARVPPGPRGMATPVLYLNC